MTVTIRPLALAALAALLSGGAVVGAAPAAAATSATCTWTPDDSAGDYEVAYASRPGTLTCTGLDALNAGAGAPELAWSDQSGGPGFAYVVDCYRDTAPAPLPATLNVVLNNADGYYVDDGASTCAAYQGDGGGAYTQTGFYTWDAVWASVSGPFCKRAGKRARPVGCTFGGR